MINEECLKSFMIYIDLHLTRRPNGRVIPVKMRNLLSDEVMRNYEHNDIFDCLSYAQKSKFVLIKKNEPLNIDGFPDVKPSSTYPVPRKQLIEGITPKGYEFLKICKDKSLWEKLKEKHLLQKAISLISTGSGVVESIQTITRWINNSR